MIILFLFLVLVGIVMVLSKIYTFVFLSRRSTSKLLFVVKNIENKWKTKTIIINSNIWFAQGWKSSKYTYLIYISQMLSIFYKYFSNNNYFVLVRSSSVPDNVNSNCWNINFISDIFSLISVRTTYAITCSLIDCS